MESRLFSTLVSILIGACSVLWAPDALACSCFPPDLTQQVNTQDHVFRARIRGPEIVFQGSRWYRARVQRTYKGCLKRGALILLKSPSSSPACGMQLDTKTTYLITAQDDGPFYGSLVLSFNSCGYTRPWNTLSADELTYLKQRYNCCDDTCVCADNTLPVQCFEDPCSVSACPMGTCTSNTCGGCHAEHSLDSGFGVCSPCTTDSDCPWEQGCTQDGFCLPTCSADEDCGDAAWCRPTEPGGMLCTPYRKEGEPCGGFTPIWAQSICAPELQCTDYPAFAVDAPGVCRLKCSTSADCGSEQYCDTANVCRDFGGCGAAGDCQVNDNAWLHPDCTGYATCTPSVNTCEWHCGDGPTCTDLQEVFFGLCNAVIGYGVVNDDCVAVSGCGSQGYPLFEDLPDCYMTCLPDKLPK